MSPRIMSILTLPAAGVVVGLVGLTWVVFAPIWVLIEITKAVLSGKEGEQ